ncbi:MAG: PAS domain S-box protein, partial [Gammaproteobacteria bacterium]|nr:PAS domain S-box protein [Gammaproteobacteria bacterium]
GQGFLESLAKGQNNQDFAYSALIDKKGLTASEVTAPGVIVPGLEFPKEPSAWLGQRQLESHQPGEKYIESYAPVFQDGEHRGFVRLGYHQPKLGLDYKQMPFLSSLTLPIFLLTPLFFLVLRQDLKPLRKIDSSIQDIMQGGDVRRVEIEAGGQLAEFMQRFNQYVEASQQKIKLLSEEQDELLINSKMLTYKKNKVDAILQNLPEAVMVIDEAGEVSYINDKVASLLGYDTEQLLGRKVRDWCSNPQLKSMLVSEIGKSNMGGSPNTLQIEADVHGKKSLQVNSYPLFSPAGDTRVLGRLVVFRDVTEDRMAQQRQSEFVAHIAHELKTPLNVLSMYSETLLDEGLNSREYQVEAVNVIHDEVERLSTLINNLLAINQYELGGVAIDRQQIRLHDLLKDAYDNAVHGKISNHLEFSLDLPRELPSINVDKDLLRIAINNLMSNAIKYSKATGKVVLTASEGEDHVEISVIDEGYGISEQDQARIFDKFFRSNDESIRSKTGHGLGLSLANQIIQIHHGELSLKSEPGKGSTFTIRLDKE